MKNAACLELRGVTKHFGGLYANDNIDFIVQEGEIVSIIGPNGAGKSTLFDCITGFYPANAGGIFFRQGDNPSQGGRDLQNGDCTHFPGCAGDKRHDGARKRHHRRLAPLR